MQGVLEMTLVVIKNDLLKAIVDMPEMNATLSRT